MNVLIVGGAGYIGAHVVKACLSAGMTVSVFDNLSTGKKVNLFPQVRFIPGDILDTKALDAAMQGQQAVVHLAAKKAVGESMENPEKYAVNNITGTLNVLNAMGKAGVRHIVFSSSAAVYGIPHIPEIDETVPTNPINFYGFTKREIERFLVWYERLRGITFVALHYFNAVGYDAEGDIRGLDSHPQNLLPIVMEVANGTRQELSIFGHDYPTPDGTCIRDYVHATDLAIAHVQALTYLASGKASQILNLGTGKGHSVLDIVRRTETLTKQPIRYVFAPRRHGDPAELRASAAKAKEVLGWQAIHSDLDTIILTTWARYQR